MSIPYHTHNFELPVATKEDVAARVSEDKVVVPATLGSAATVNVEQLATAAQGKLAENAAPKKRQIIAGAGLCGGGDLENDITLELSAEVKEKLRDLREGAGIDFTYDHDNKNITITLSQEVQEAVGLAQSSASRNRKIIAGDGLAGGGTLEQNISLSLSPELAKWIKKLEAGPGINIASSEKARQQTIGLSVEVQESLKTIETAVPQERNIVAGDGLAGGGSLKTDVTLSLAPDIVKKIKNYGAGEGIVFKEAAQDATKIEVSLDPSVQEHLSLIDTAVQHSDIGSLATKSKVTVQDIEAAGDLEKNRFLCATGAWLEVTSQTSNDLNKQLLASTGEELRNLFYVLTPKGNWVNELSNNLASAFLAWSNARHQKNSGMEISSFPYYSQTPQFPRDTSFYRADTSGIGYIILYAKVKENGKNVGAGIPVFWETTFPEVLYDGGTNISYTDAAGNAYKKICSYKAVDRFLAAARLQGQKDPSYIPAILEFVDLNFGPFNMEKGINTDRIPIKKCTAYRVQIFDSKGKIFLSDQRADLIAIEPIDGVKYQIQDNDEDGLSLLFIAYKPIKRFCPRIRFKTADSLQKNGKGAWIAADKTIEYYEK